MLRALIMAGGSGTRFWPQSRQSLPKQFLRFFGERSLLQLAYDRIKGVVGAQGVFVFTNERLVGRTREQLSELSSDHVVGEPCGRDTAACIGLAASILAARDPHSRMIVLAADHLIQPTEAFHAAVRAADDFCQSHPEALVTFGIRPTRPATAYGYLRRDEKCGEPGGVPVYRLAGFHEKPDLARAEEFVASGEYFWNAGIFCWRTETILSEIERLEPALFRAVCRIVDAWNTPRRESVFASEFERLEKVSIDFAVMEKSKEVYMIEAPFEWDDVGSWGALERVLPADEAGNVGIGARLALDTRSTIVVTSDDHLVATLGVSDLIIVHAGDATLIAHKKDEQEVKRLLSMLESQGLEQYL